MNLAAPVAAAVLALVACDKFDYLPPNPVEPWPTRVLMHRGGGSDHPHPNTLDAVLYGLGLPGFHGVEIDVQISAGGSLWLGHDNEVHDCGGNVVGCFQDLDDAAIAQHATCGDPPAPQYDRLDDVLAAVEGLYPSALYSLDIKGQYCRTIGRDEARAMADEVDRLVRLHGLQGRVAVETEQREFMERLAEIAAPVFGFVVSLGDVDGPLSAAARLGATGISFKFAPESEPLSASVIAGIHGVGQRIIVWTVNDPADIAAVWPMLPDVIETDNAAFFEAVPP